MIKYQIQNNYNVITKNKLIDIPMFYVIDNDYPIYQETKTGSIYMNWNWRRRLTLSKTPAQWQENVYEGIDEFLMYVAKKFKLNYYTLLRQLVNNTAFYEYYILLNYIYSQCYNLQNRLNNDMYYDGEDWQYKYNNLIATIDLKYDMSIVATSQEIQITNNSKTSKSISLNPNQFKFKTIIPPTTPPAIQGENIYMYGTVNITLTGDYTDVVLNKTIYILRNSIYGLF